VITPVAALVSDLVSSGDRALRAEAALLELVHQGKDVPAIVEGVRPLADHADARVRTRAIMVLSEALGASVLPILEAHLSDLDGGVRAAIEDAAEDIGEAGRGLLKRLVADSDMGVRFWAAVTLSEAGDADGSKVLVEGLQSSYTRFEALQGLFRLGEKSAEEPVRRIMKKWFLPAIDRVAAAGLLAKLGDMPARKLLLEEIARRKSDVRGLAIAFAGDLPLSEAVPTLEKILSDKKDPMRGAAAVALGRMKVERLTGELARILGDEAEDVDMRASAAEGLGALGTPEATQALNNALTSVKDAELRQAIEEALGQ